ncbi:hypothetical protein HK097_001780 [Rhizophlyctis rosea]|uniref:SP-RING-type domain-containing protein n=1 Tax=Rhizophlyctis rosea TaxID=64517 RepID=A0AAD5S453_9FUNG|nr:hypothetical protein HK097_001780 [Rhizophlyctis rosea]
MSYNQSKASGQQGWGDYPDPYAPPGVDQYNAQGYGMAGSSMAPPGTANTAGTWNAGYHSQPQWPGYYGSYGSYGSYGDQSQLQATPVHIATAPLPPSTDWRAPPPPPPDFPKKQPTQSSAPRDPRISQLSSGGVKPISGGQAPAKPAGRPLSNSATTVTDISGIPHVFKPGSNVRQSSDDLEIDFYEDRQGDRQGNRRESATAGGKSTSKPDSRAPRVPTPKTTTGSVVLATALAVVPGSGTGGAGGPGLRHPEGEGLRALDVTGTGPGTAPGIAPGIGVGIEADPGSAVSGVDPRIGDAGVEIVEVRAAPAVADARRNSNDAGSRDVNRQANGAAAGPSQEVERDRNGDILGIDRSPLDWLQTKPQYWPVDPIDGDDHSAYDSSMRKVVRDLASATPPIHVDIQPIYEQRLTPKNMIQTDRDTDYRKRFVVQLPTEMILPWLPLMAKNPKTKKLGLSVFQMPKKNGYSVKDSRLIHHRSAQNDRSTRDFLVMCNGQYLELGEPKAFDFAWDILPAVKRAQEEKQAMLVFQIVTCWFELKQGFCTIQYMQEGGPFDDIPMLDPKQIFYDPTFRHISQADHDAMNDRARQLHQGQMNAQNSIYHQLDQMKTRQKWLENQTRRMKDSVTAMEKREASITARERALDDRQRQVTALQNQYNNNNNGNQNKGKQTQQQAQPTKLVQPNATQQGPVMPTNTTDPPPEHLSKRQKKDWRKQQEDMRKGQQAGPSNSAPPPGRPNHPQNQNQNQNQGQQGKKRPAPPAPDTSQKRNKGATGANTVPQANTNTNNNQRRPARAEESDDEGFAVGEEIVSLKCPITMTRIQDPVKGFECSHLQCFDRGNFDGLNSGTKPKWRCPVCDRVLGPGPHATNLLFAQLLTAYPNASRVAVKSNGTHEAAPEESGKKGKKSTTVAVDVSGGKEGSSSGYGADGGGGGKGADDDIIVLSDDD